MTIELLEDLRYRDTESEDEEKVEKEEDELPTYEDMQESVRKGMIAVEAGLFEHASTEYSRIPRLRKALDSLEGTILSDDFISQMKDKPKSALKLYSMIRQILDNSVHFLQETHDMALKQHEVQKLLDALEKLSGGGPKKSEAIAKTDPGLLEAVRKTMREYYQNKTQNNK